MRHLLGDGYTMGMRRATCNVRTSAWVMFNHVLQHDIQSSFVMIAYVLHYNCAMLYCSRLHSV